MISLMWKVGHWIDMLWSSSNDDKKTTIVIYCVVIVLGLTLTVSITQFNFILDMIKVIIIIYHFSELSISGCVVCSYNSTFLLLKKIHSENQHKQIKG